MDIAEVKTPDSLTLALKGRLDSTTSAAFETRLLTQIAAGERRLVVDMTDLDYISSAGLRVLLVVAKRLNPLGGKLVLCGLRPAVTQVFEIAGFATLFPIAATRDEAAAKLA